MKDVTELTIEGVSVGFPLGDSAGRRVVLDEVSLRIPEGSFISLLGPSGCGKSTLLNVIGGFVEALSGRVALAGRTITEPGPDRGMVFQNYTLYPWMTVRQNIEFGPSLHSWPAKRRSEVSRRLLDLVRLADYADDFPKSLSGGMRQRVAIARALALDPSILLMDEPFGALDAQTRADMQELLLDVWAKTKKTIVFVTHDIDESIYLSERVLIMGTRPGRVIDDLAIDLPRPRTIDVTTSAAFSAYKRHILHVLRH